MRRREMDDWGRPPAEGHPQGLSGPGDERHEEMWAGTDPVTAQLRGGGRLLPAALAGILAGAVGATTWVLLSLQTGAIFSVMTLGIGYLVGMAVRWVGRERRSALGVLAAAITLASSLAGLVVSVAAIMARQQEIPLRQVLEGMNASGAFDALRQGVSPFFVVLLLFAVYESFRTAVLAVTPPGLDEDSEAEGRSER